MFICFSLFIWVHFSSKNVFKKKRKRWTETIKVHKHGQKQMLYICCDRHLSCVGLPSIFIVHGYIGPCFQPWTLIQIRKLNIWKRRRVQFSIWSFTKFGHSFVLSTDILRLLFAWCPGFNMVVCESFTNCWPADGWQF